MRKKHQEYVRETLRENGMDGRDVEREREANLLLLLPLDPPPLQLSLNTNLSWSLNQCNTRGCLPSLLVCQKKKKKKKRKR